MNGSSHSYPSRKCVSRYASSVFNTRNKQGPLTERSTQFVIQADFVTQANRQGIVTDSSRNEGLIDAIAGVFMEAVKQMCRHPTLKYQWMRYLPRSDDINDSYWSRLVAKIGEKLKVTPVLELSASNDTLSPLRLIQDCRRNSRDELDRSGRVLFRDITPNLYLSTNYQSDDLNLLGGHGLNFTIWEEIIDRVAWDLAQKDSRIRSIKDEDWQSRAAALLAIPFLTRNPTTSFLHRKIRELRLLPLRTGQWVSKFANKPVYFPRVKDTNLDIPLDIDWDVIDPSAIANKERKALFDKMDVTSVYPPTVRDAILATYRSPVQFGIKESAYHLRFLYLTEHFGNSVTPWNLIKLMSHECKFIWSTWHHFYLRDDSPYGAAKLLQATPSGTSPGAGAPGLDVTYLNDAYLQDVPNPPRHDAKPFHEWLYELYNIRQHLPIVDYPGVKLSEIVIYIADHRPEKLLGFLKETWESEKPSIKNDSAAVRQLGDVRVLCQRRNKTQMIRLKHAYLPLRELRELCDRFLLDTEFFPFLELEEPLSHDMLPLEWETLGKLYGLGLHRFDSVDFVLLILKAIFEQSNASTVERPERMLDLYTYLEAKVMESESKDGCRDKIR